MNGKTYINGDELTALANSLKAKSENILSTYKGDCAQAIQMSSECLQLSGLNTTEFFQALEKIYTQVNERIASFADFLTNVVVAEYNAVSEAITSSFNNEFANEIAGLLGISVSASIGPITRPAIPGVPIPKDPPIAELKPYPGDKRGDVIELDPREWDGTFRTQLEPMSREEGNKSPVPVYLDDDGTAVAVTTKKDIIPPVDTTPAAPVKPNLPPLNETGGRGHAANDTIRAVQFDEGTGTTTAQPAVQPAVEAPKPTVKPDLPPLPGKSSSSSSTKSYGSGSYSSGGFINTGGGGGGGMAAAIALDSMSNPLNRLK